MSEKTLMKGNEAIAEGAIIAGCRHYFGYPITPQSEISEYFAWRMPEVGGVFLQAESELAAVNMAFGASCVGKRSMTSSSSPGISLKLETISTMAGAEVPCFIVNINRGGPGVGCIQGAQGDYFQAVKGGGHGDYRIIVYAPNSVQEMMDLTIKAFIKGDEYRTPVMLLGDGYTGQMMEPITIREPVTEIPTRDWAACGCEGRDYVNQIFTLYNHPTLNEPHNLRLQAKYRLIEEKEIMWEEINTSDADIVLVGYGICARVAVTVMNRAKALGLKVGIFRPITLWPFPTKPLQALASRIKGLLVVEQNAGQMVEDVRLAVGDSVPVEFHGRLGGALPETEDVLAMVKAMAGK